MSLVLIFLIELCNLELVYCLFSVVSIVLRNYQIQYWSNERLKGAEIVLVINLVEMHFVVGVLRQKFDYLIVTSVFEVFK